MFPVFVKLFLGGITTGSDYYYRRSNTTINLFEHVVVQPFIRYRYVTNVYSIPLWHTCISYLTHDLKRIFQYLFIPWCLNTILTHCTNYGISVYHWAWFLYQKLILIRLNSFLLFCFVFWGGWGGAQLYGSKYSYQI